MLNRPPGGQGLGRRPLTLVASNAPIRSMDIVPWFPSCAADPVGRRRRPVEQILAKSLQFSARPEIDKFILVFGEHGFSWGRQETSGWRLTSKTERIKVCVHDGRGLAPFFGSDMSKAGEEVDDEDLC